MKKLRISIVVLSILASTAAAQALTFNYNTVISGDTPNGTSPWLTAVFSEYSMMINETDTEKTAGVLLSLSASGLDLPGEFVSKWAFNTTLSDISGMKYKMESRDGTALKNNNENNPPVEFKLNDVSAGATGDHARYDIGFTFLTSGQNKFEKFDFAKIFLYGVAGLDPEMFNTANDDGYYAEAHIQGIAGDGDGSSWVVPVTTPVPEPGTMVLLGAGFLGLAIYGKRRKNS